MVFVFCFHHILIANYFIEVSCFRLAENAISKQQRPGVLSFAYSNHISPPFARNGVGGFPLWSPLIFDFMQLSKQAEDEIKSVMNDYWDSYFRGDIAHWERYLVDDYRNIGGTEEEIWNSKKEILDYTYRMMDQLVGASEIRNKRFEIIPFDPYIMVHEYMDIFIKIEEEWTFYQKFRLSSLIQQTADGWKVLHQHGSYPDSKTEEGEAFAFDTIKNENLRLKEAIKSRTSELEESNRELEIEAALERVRSRSMAMQKSEELADAALVLFEQLSILGVTHERINIGIVNEPDQSIDFWVTEQGGKRLNTRFCGRISEPTTLAKTYQAWKNNEKSIVIDLSGDELGSWLKFMKEEIKIPFDPAYLHTRRVQTAGFFSRGMLVVTSPEPLAEEALYLLEKFAGVFDLTYTRFNDLKIAEAHAAQAELDLLAIKVAKQRAEDALSELESAQEQLIQQEKLASLGQLTAGIAHEIKNPLNFVNNFSELSKELLDEAFEELERFNGPDSKDEIIALLRDVKHNLAKIHEHGTRADSIVKSMLQHSRCSSSKREPKDLNALVREFVNLSFHGMRAGKVPINVEIDLQLDPLVGEVPMVSEDFSRVILNLCNNAFDAMRDKLTASTEMPDSYTPKLTVKTSRVNGKINLAVRDNGPGIPKEIQDKILQPFFTTKKGTEGTGLGLSITHDIIKSHGAELKMESEPGAGTVFSVLLPME